jgi:hypothetical protein
MRGLEPADPACHIVTIGSGSPADTMADVGPRHGRPVSGAVAERFRGWLTRSRRSTCYRLPAPRAALEHQSARSGAKLSTVTPSASLAPIWVASALTPPTSGTTGPLDRRHRAHRSVEHLVPQSFNSGSAAGCSSGDTCRTGRRRAGVVTCALLAKRHSHRCSAPRRSPRPDLLSAPLGCTPGWRSARRPPCRGTLRRW